MMGPEDRLRHAGRVTVGGTGYAAGLFWQPADDPNRVASEAKTVAQTEGVDADFLCVVPGSPAQYGLGWRQAGHAAGLRPLALAVTANLDGSFIGAFRAGDRWWFGYAHSGVVLPEGDNLYATEQECREAFSRQFPDAPSDCEAYAPAAWGYEDTSELTLEAAVGAPPKIRLRSTESVFARLRTAVLLLILLLMVGGAGGYYWWQDLQEKERIRQENLRILNTARANERPWQNVPLPGEVLRVCHDRLNALPIIVPGWQLLGAQCGAAGPTNWRVSSEWSLSTGFLEALRVAADARDFQMTLGNDGDSATLTSGTDMPITRRAAGIDTAYEELWTGERLQQALWELQNRLDVAIKLTGQPARGSRRPVFGADGEPLNAYEPPPTLRFEIDANIPIREWSDIFNRLPGSAIDSVEWDARNGQWTLTGRIYMLYSGDAR